MTAPEPVLRLLFDEAHSEAWSTRPEVAAAMQPSHPQDASYARAAEVLRARRIGVEPHVAGPLDAAALADADVLVLAHPADARHERTTGVGSPLLAPAELDAVEAFVTAGGGLVVLGECQQDIYGANTDALLHRFGLGLDHDTVQDHEACHRGVPTWILADLAEGETGRDGDLLAGVGAACFGRSGTVRVEDPRARVLARAGATSTAPGAPLAAAVRHGAGRVVAFADSDLFGDDCLDDLGHRALWHNVVVWAGAARLRRPASPRGAASVAATPAWRALREATDALGLTQEPDGRVAPGREDEALGQVAVMRAALDALASEVPHDAAHLAAAREDLTAWASAGLGVPDFGRALEAFRPQERREHGLEHVVVLPMYTQNGSRDTRFEALVCEVVWPDWLAELEAERYANPSFVPVRLVAHTAGYASECAVLFPETVAVADRAAHAPNHFGAIFCDREAERLRRVAGAAVDLLGVRLPADAVALLSSEQLSVDTYALWDLIHDRAHSRGDLPFDPFMIRQRMPYWMYALEELRCDLVAFTEAVALEREGFASARCVQVAMLLDRALRFPVTGSRVRNYDGLGGQLLFAHLHRRDVVRWTDNRLTVDWERLADGVQALRDDVEALYRAGIDRSKLAQWSAAHDLVAGLVPPAAGSRWAAGVRSYAEAPDPRPYLDDVAPDEFPLSMFYTSLQSKLAPALVRPEALAA